MRFGFLRTWWLCVMMGALAFVLLNLSLPYLLAALIPPGTADRDWALIVLTPFLALVLSTVGAVLLTNERRIAVAAMMLVLANAFVVYWYHNPRPLWLYIPPAAF